MITERAMRAVLVVIGAFHAGLGLLALIDPGTFFDQIGRYGAENDHYIGDAGAFHLAYGLAALVAAGRSSWRVAVLGLGAFWYGIHALNHAFDVGEARSTARGVADTVLLALGGAFLAYLARAASRLGAEPEGRATGSPAPGR